MMTETDQAQAERIRAFCDSTWDDTIVPTLTEYIRIPNKSPHFDPDWEENGHMERAVELIELIELAARPPKLSYPSLYGR